MTKRALFWLVLSMVSCERSTDLGEKYVISNIDNLRVIVSTDGSQRKIIAGDGTVSRYSDIFVGPYVLECTRHGTYLVGRTVPVEGVDDYAVGWFVIDTTIGEVHDGLSKDEVQRYVKRDVR